MNAMRQIVIPQNGFLSIKLPPDLTANAFEVIVLPVENGAVSKNAQKLAQAHRDIIAGGGIENVNDFLVAFEENRQDRKLPFRD